MAGKIIHVVQLGASGTTGGSIADAILNLPDVFVSLPPFTWL